MSQQHGSGGGDVARGAGYAALLGAALIGVAVIIGIVLLQIGDRNDNGPVTAASRGKTTTTKHTTTTKPHKGHTSGSTSGSTKPARSPSAVRLIVLNGGAPSGQAGRVAASLKLKGYTDQPKDANTWVGHRQTGTTVYCRDGFSREGASLAIAAGSGATLRIPFSKPAPPYTSGFDCAVIVGS